MFVPWAFLLAAIASFLLVVWICIYIYSIHRPNYVLVKKGEGFWLIDLVTAEEDKDKYSKLAKGTYVYYHITSPLIFIFIYLGFFFFIKCWIEKEN